MQKSTKNVGTVKGAGIKQEIEVKQDAEKYGKYSADVTTIKMEAEEEGNPNAEMSLRLMKLMFGPEGMTTRTIFLKDRVVQVIGGSKEDVGKVLEGVERQPAQTPAAGATKPAAAATKPAGAATKPAVPATTPAGAATKPAATKPAANASPSRRMA